MVSKRLLVRAGVVAAALFAAYVLAGFLFAPPLLKRRLTHKLEGWFRRPTAIRSVRCNPFTLSIRIEGLSVYDRETKGPLLYVEEVRADLELRSIYLGAPVFRRFEITNPRARLVRLGPQQFNVSDLLKRASTRRGGGEGPRFSLSRILLRGGRLDLEDRTGGPSHALTDIQLLLPFLSTLPVEGAAEVAPEFEAVFDGKPVRLEGTFRDFSGGREAMVGVTLDGFDLKPLFDLLSADSTARVASGLLDCKGWLTFVVPRKGAATSGFRGEVTLRDFRLEDLEQRPLIELPRLELAVDSASFAPPAFRLSRMAFQAPALHLREGQKVQVFLEPPGEKAPETPQERGKKPPESPEGKSPVPFSCELLEVTGGSVHYEDPSRKDLPPFVLSDLRISVRGLSNAPSSRASVDVDARTDLGETLHHQGTVTLTPFSAQGTFRGGGLHLEVLSHLFKEKLPFGVEGGTGNFSGSYELGAKPAGQHLTLKNFDAILKEVHLKEKGSGEALLDIPSVTLAGARMDFSSASFSALSLESRGLRVHARRDAGGKVNLSPLLRPVHGPEQGSPEGEPPPGVPAGGAGRHWTYSIQSVRALESGFHWEDLAGGRHVTLEGEPMDILFEDLSNATGHRSKVSVSAHFEDGGSFSGDGTVGFGPFSADGTLHLRRIQLEDLSPLYRDFVSYDVEGGAMDTDAGLELRTGGETGRLALHEIAVSVGPMRLKTRADGKTFLESPALVMTGADLDVNARTFTAKELVLRKGKVTVVRGADGRLNLAQLFPRVAAAASTLSTTSKAKPWLFALASFKLDGCSAAVEDRRTSPPVSFSLSSIQLAAKDLSTDLKNPSRVDFTLVWNGSGSLSGHGTAGLRPLSGALAVEARKADLTPLSPYMPDWLDATLAGGLVSGGGDFTFRQQPDGRFSCLYAGDASLEGLSLLEGPGPFEILTWKGLSLRGLKAGALPGILEVREAELLHPFIRVVVSPEGKWNVADLIRTVKPEGASPQKTKGAGLPPPPFPVKVGSLTLRGGSASFSDRSVPQPLSNKIGGLDVRIAGFSSEPGARAKVDLQGLLGGGAPVRISGSLDPVGPDLYADLKGSVEGFDATRLSPYAARYLGHTIQKGRLSLDLTYHLEGGRLSGDNHVHLERFAWGEKAESPDAQDRSVVMATRLLTDRRGAVDFHVPVTGTLDDPQFHLKTVVGQAFRGFLAKAVLAPFTLLGTPFGGGTQELSYAEFVAGGDDPTPEGVERIRTLAKALADRPAVNLEITGRACAAADAEGLKRALLEEELLLDKLESLRAGGGAAVPLSRASLLPAEYPTCLERLYRKSFALADGAHAPPRSDMERALLRGIRVDDAALLELAGRRAEAARQVFFDSGTAPRRLLLVAPRLQASEGGRTLPGSRVDFALR